MRQSPHKNPAQRRPARSPGLYHHTAPGRKAVPSPAHHPRVPFHVGLGRYDETARPSWPGTHADPAGAQLLGYRGRGEGFEGWGSPRPRPRPRRGAVPPRDGGPSQTGQGSGEGLPHQPFQTPWPWLPAGPAPNLGWRHWPLSETSIRTKTLSTAARSAGRGHQ